jgi:hypothetical protein
VNNSEPIPPKKFTLKPWRPSANIPGELRAVIEKRILEQKYDGVAEYLLALIVFDLWAGRDHKLTGPLMREPSYIREAVLLEIIADLAKGDTGEKKPGGWFDKRLAELVEEARRKEPRNG